QDHPSSPKRNLMRDHHLSDSLRNPERQELWDFRFLQKCLTNPQILDNVQNFSLSKKITAEENERIFVNDQYTSLSEEVTKLDDVNKNKAYEGRLQRDVKESRTRNYHLGSALKRVI
ncbi:15713_t:CDS:2, partial [Funneliformis mosseae]